MESIEYDDDQKEAERDVCQIRLTPGVERHICSGDALSLEGSAESDGRQADADPGEQVGDSRQIQEPAEDGSGAGPNSQIAKEGKYECEGDGNPGKTFLAAFQEYPGRLSVLGQPKEISRTSVEEGIGGGCGAGNNDGVDNRVEYIDLGYLDPNDLRTPR